MKDKKIQGKKNRAAGARFELKVRHDLESKDWIVSKWMNQVEFGEIYSFKKRVTEKDIPKNIKNISQIPKRLLNKEDVQIGKLIAAKHKFRGVGIPMVMGTGFPDFIAYKFIQGFPKKEDEVLLCSDGLNISMYDGWEIIGVESKSNGYLSKEEKEKCKWLLDNNKFSKILIASKGKKRGEIEYKEFENGK